MDARIYREPLEGKTASGDVRLGSMGWRERMQPVVLDYAAGLPCWLFMVFHSPGEVTVSGEVERIGSGGVFIWSPGMPQRYGNAQEVWEHSWLHVLGRGLGDWLKSAQIPVGEVIEARRVSGRLGVYFRRFFEERSLYAEAHQGVMGAQLRSMLWELGRSIGEPTQEAVPEGLERAKLFIDANFHRSLSLEIMARSGGMSVSHFCALFRQHYGRAPGRYHLDGRMELAKFYLADRRVRVSEAAVRVGYPDVYQFSRMFKRVVGVSPVRLRGDK